MGVDKNCNISEEMASLVTFKNTKTISNVVEGIMATLNRLGLNLTNLSGDSAWCPCSGRKNTGIGEVNANKSN
jgi:hypothetical protein